jgi:tRNA threonylcarbamoyl adenosine modification protein YeaZ
MKILALEFSSPERSVAAAGTDAGEASRPVSEIVETGDRATNGLKMIDAALRQSGFEREQIECLVIGTGPGSYTGVRAAIALAQGWQLARGVRLLGIRSDECIAAQAQAGGASGRVEVVIDAQRGEFYLATYELSAGSRREISPLRIATLAEVKARESAGGVLIGPEVTRWFPGGRTIFPRASTLARLAAGRNDFLAGEKLEPVYLRETNFVKAAPPRVLPGADGR